MRLRTELVPVRDPVVSVCEMLGYDPYYLACEGRVVAVVAKEAADAALAVWKKLPQGKDAAIIGMVENSNPQTGHPGPAALGSVLSPKPHIVLQTELGGERVLDELEDDPLPRIC